MENQSHSRIFIYLLVVFFAVFVGSGLFLAGQAKKNQPENQEAATTNNPSTIKQGTMVIPTSIPTIGSLSLIMANDEPQTYAVNNNIGINLLADSAGENIVGYDVVLYYDPLAFEFVQAESLLDDFTIYSNNKGNYLLLTGAKSLGSQTASVFDGFVAHLIFTPKKTGKHNFSFRESADKEKTNLVTDKTEVLSPALTDLSVEITE